jgi:hypothetical protein
MNRNTPRPVARQLRQEAGFGCCVCGKPIITYHHIVPWADDHHFRPDDMMVLCLEHHDQADKKVISEAEQRRFKAKPYNIEHGRPGGLLKVNQGSFAADFGGIIVANDGPFLSIDGEALVSLYRAEDRLEISLKLFSQNDDLLVEIERNEWISGDPLPWDIEADWQTLTLRERARRISLSIDASENPVRITGEFWKSGELYYIHDDGIQTRYHHVQPGMTMIGMNLQFSKNTLVFPSDGTIIVGSPTVSDMAETLNVAQLINLKT